jgi:ABC-2 type transport system ATP-binding protein
MPIVEVQDLVRYYGRLRALDCVSFSMDKGEIIGVLGLNGAGKSTCLRILAGLLKPTAGKAEIGGRNVLDDPMGVREQVGFLPEDPPLYLDMTVEAFLRHAGQLKGMTRAEVDARLPDVCDTCGLDVVTRMRIIDELSHGYRKRVGIAQAILHKPALVILDEPISGLDPAQIVEMRKTVRALREEHSVLVSSHILTEISQTCDRILVFHGGKLVAEGPEETLTRHAGRRLEIVARGSSAVLEKIVAEEVRGSVLRIETEEAGLVTATVSLADETHGSSEAASADPVEALVAALVAGGLGVRRVAEADGELEAVFLGLTGTVKTDAALASLPTAAAGHVIAKEEVA